MSNFEFEDILNVLRQDEDVRILEKDNVFIFVYKKQMLFAVLVDTLDQEAQVFSKAIRFFSH